MSDPATTVGVLLRRGRPDRLPELAAEHLRRHHAAERTEVLLGDYTLSRLTPVIDEATMPGGDGAARCFGSQHPVIEQRPDGSCRWHLPLRAWGERLGVLMVDLPVAGSPADPLMAVADELALALRAADGVTDRYSRVRRQQRLTMAAELQWQLLPGRSLGDDRFTVAGQLEPAYAVCGDHFDWSVDSDRLTITVLNGHGDGLDAALLSVVAVNAMRNARRSGANIVEQAELASEAVHAQYGGDRHAATLLLEVDLESGAVAAVDAGSPRAILARANELHPIKLEEQLPLGMFGDIRYELQHFRLAPGDRLLVVSDGVHAAAPGGRAPYGETALSAALRRTRLQPATEAVGTVIRGLREYHAGADPTDDAVIVCLDRSR